MRRKVKIHPLGQQRAGAGAGPGQGRKAPSALTGRGLGRGYRKAARGWGPRRWGCQRGGQYLWWAGVH